MGCDAESLGTWFLAFRQDFNDKAFQEEGSNLQRNLWENLKGCGNINSW